MLNKSITIIKLQKKEIRGEEKNQGFYNFSISVPYNKPSPFFIFFYLFRGKEKARELRDQYCCNLKKYKGSDKMSGDLNIFERDINS